MGYLITYANCAIVWGSKRQSLVALSTMEAELIAALWEVIHLQNLLLELRGCNFPIPFTKPQVVCRTFEDNAACIEVAQSDHKIRPRTKHLLCTFFTSMTMSKKGSLKLSMSHLNISSPIFLCNLCPMINTCASAIRLWGGRQLHLLNTSECEVIVGSASKCLPTSVPVLPILLSAILYCLQYMQSFPPIVCLFYLTRCFHSELFVPIIQPGLYTFTYDYPNLPQNMTKFSVDNSVHIISAS